MRDPFTQLMDEHRVIEKVLAALEAAAGQEVPAGFYERAIDFIRSYADGYHHAKEEERLFVYLEERGMPRDYGPLGVMVGEHDTGRAHVDAMQGQLEAGDFEALRRESLAFVGLMRDHITKEDEVLFPMGRAMLTPDEVAEIQAGFDTIAEPEPSCEAFAKGAADLLAEVVSAT